MPQFVELPKTQENRDITSALLRLTYLRRPLPTREYVDRCPATLMIPCSTHSLATGVRLPAILSVELLELDAVY
jgi:hypothetical protein